MEQNKQEILGHYGGLATRVLNTLQQLIPSSFTQVQWILLQQLSMENG